MCNSDSPHSQPEDGTWTLHRNSFLSLAIAQIRELTSSYMPQHFGHLPQAMGRDLTTMHSEPLVQ